MGKVHALRGRGEWGVKPSPCVLLTRVWCPWCPLSPVLSTIDTVASRTGTILSKSLTPAHRIHEDGRRVGPFLALLGSFGVVQGRRKDARRVSRKDQFGLGGTGVVGGGVRRSTGTPSRRASRRMACRRARGLGCWRLDFLRGTVTTSLGGLQWLRCPPSGEVVRDGHTASIPDGVQGRRLVWKATIRRGSNLPVSRCGKRALVPGWDSKGGRAVFGSGGTLQKDYSQMTVSGPVCGWPG